MQRKICAGFGWPHAALRLGILLAGLLAPWALLGCGDECSAAGDKLASCGVTGDAGDNTSLACSGFYQCQSHCANSATCTEIKYQPQGHYVDCLKSCGGR